MSFTEGTVTVPGAGKVKKRYLAIPATAAAAYVAWRWYQARQNANAAPAPSDGTYTSPDLTDYGLSTSGGTTTIGGNTGSVQTDATNPSAINTNADWTNKAVELLTNQGYDGMTVQAALGEFLARRALDKTEASIARAALAVAGQPPQNGPFSVIEEAGTSTGTLAAPTNLHVTKVGTEYVNLAWNTVPGASEYAVYRSDTGTMSVRAGQGSVTVYGLKPHTGYRFQVAAVGSTGKIGPKSAAVAATTGKVTLTRPTSLRASAVTRTSFRVTAGRVAGATYYRWYVNGHPSGASDQPYRDFTGLRRNTVYAISVAADTTNQVPGPTSAVLRVRTKK